MSSSDSASVTSPAYKPGALIEAVQVSNIKLVRDLLERNADIVNEKNELLNTPLILAAANNNAEMVRLLLRYNPSLGERNKAGLTAQEVAERHGFKELAAVLKRAAEGEQQLTEKETVMAELHALTVKKQDRLKALRASMKLKPI